MCFPKIHQSEFPPKFPKQFPLKNINVVLNIEWEYDVGNNLCHQKDTEADGNCGLQEEARNEAPTIGNGLTFHSSFYFFQIFKFYHGLIILIKIWICYLKITLRNVLKARSTGAPAWLSRLGVWLQLRSWSHSSWVQALCRALCWQLRAWRLLRILCLPLSLSLPACTLSLSKKINKR